MTERDRGDHSGEILPPNDFEVETAQAMIGGLGQVIGLKESLRDFMAYLEGLRPEEDLIEAQLEMIKRQRAKVRDIEQAARDRGISLPEDPNQVSMKGRKKLPQFWALERTELHRLEEGAAELTRRNDRANLAAELGGLLDRQGATLLGLQGEWQKLLPESDEPEE